MNDERKCAAAFLTIYPSSVKIHPFPKHPAEESNLVLQIRSLPCRPSHSQGLGLKSHVSLYGSHDLTNAKVSSSPSRNRTWSNSFGSCDAIHHTHGPLLHRSIPTWSRTRAPTEGWSWTLGGSRAVHYTIETHSRADDWNCTSMSRFTKPAPHCSATSAFLVPMPPTFPLPNLKVVGCRCDGETPKGRSARIRTLWGGFGNHLLSQEHTPVSFVRATPGAAPRHRAGHCLVTSPIRRSSTPR